MIPLDFVFSPEGAYISRFGRDGDEEEQFCAPYALAVDQQGRVSGSDANGIQVFDADGRYLDIIHIKRTAFGLDFDDQGYLYTITNEPRALKYETLIK